jgi:hypothetical protein
MHNNSPFSRFMHMPPFRENRDFYPSVDLNDMSGYMLAVYVEFTVSPICFADSMQSAQDFIPNFNPIYLFSDHCFRAIKILLLLTYT